MAALKVTRTISQAGMATASLAGLIVFLISTQPSEHNFRLSFVPLLFLWIFLYSIVGIFVRLLFRSMRRSLSQVIRIAAASSIVLLIMFRALGQLSAIDIFVMLALVVLGSFYFSRTWRS